MSPVDCPVRVDFRGSIDLVGPAFTRRQALAACAAGAAGALVSAWPVQLQAAEVDLQKLPWIDAHSHVWSPDVQRWPLAGKQTVEDLKPRSFTPEELLALAEPEKVGRVVLIQHSVYHLFDNSYLLDCWKRFPGRFSVVGMLDDKQPDCGAKLRELLPQGVRGLRITPRVGGPKWLESDGMQSLWKTGAETGQAMCCLIDASDLPAVAAMCQRHPGTPVVIDHISRIGADGTIREADVQALCDLAKHKRVSVKISAFYALGKKAPPYEDLVPLIRRVLDAYGVERCMWASDCPYQLGGENSYPASIGLVRDRLRGLSAGDKEWLLAKAAERVFFA
jgi:predicted TIM-barrel fold metal-dependent hydrolase